MLSSARIPSFQRDHLPSLDGLRAVAILLVLWFHLPRSVLPTWINQASIALDPGYFGVDLFFVLSGFLITRILLFDKQSRTKGCLRQFYLRRAFRIFPIYYLLLTVCAIVATHGAPIPFWVYLNNFVYIFHGGPGYLRHTWSLAVEEHFYIVFPLLVYFSPTKWGGLASLIVLPGIAMISIVLFRSLELNKVQLVDYVYMASNVRMLSLTLGAGMAYVEPWLRLSWIRSACIAATVFLASAIALLWLPKASPFYFEFRTLLAAGVCWGTLLGVVSADWGHLRFNVLRLSALAYLGSISYGLYLYHQPLFSAFRLHDSPTSGRVALAVLTVFLVASLSHHLVERPLIKVGRRLTSKKSGNAGENGSESTAFQHPLINTVKKVAVQQASLASYRVPVFRELARFSTIDLTVFSGGLKAFDNQTSHEFLIQEIPVKRFRFVGVPVFWHAAQWKAANKMHFDVCVLVWNVQYLNLIPSMLRARFGGVRTVLWGHGFSKRESWLRRFSRDLFARFADAILFYDQSTAKSFESRNAWARGRCYVAANTIETTKIDECRDQLLPMVDGVATSSDRLRDFRESVGLIGPTLLYVSRFDANNRVDLLVEAFGRMAKIDSKMRLVIIGKGNPESESLRSLIQKLGLEKVVIVLGAVYDEAELAPWFCSADLFVYPANIGLSLNHAMAYGLPVITSDALEKQNPEINYLIPGKNGLLYRDGNVCDLVRVIEAGLESSRNRQMSECARQTMAHWTLARMVDGLRAAIEAGDGNVIVSAKQSMQPHRGQADKDSSDDDRTESPVGIEPPTTTENS